MKLPLDKLTPPDDPLRSWRWIVAFVIFLLIIHVGFSRGLIFDGVGAFAYASDVKENGKKVDRILTLQIASALRELKKEECRADGNKVVIQAAIETYQQDYRALTGVRYPLLECASDG